MRTLLPLAGLVMFVALGCPVGHAASEIALERRTFFQPAAIKAWSPAESTITVSNDRTVEAAPTFRWHVGVDYQHGEVKYPIGWPRVSYAIPAGPLRDWSDWDYLHCWVYTATNRDALPGIPAGLGLHTPDRAGAYQRTLTELKKDQWVEIKLPLSQIPRHHDVRQLQFHIAESNYRDGDQLDFYISDLALLRYRSPTLLEFSPESAVVLVDAKDLPVRVHAAGLPAGSQADVICELLRDGTVAARTTLMVNRGAQTRRLGLGPTPLTPGSYVLQARFAGGTQIVTARVRIVESPWP